MIVNLHLVIQNMKIILVVNPISGGINKSGFLDFCKNELFRYDISCAILTTSGSGDENILSERIRDYQPDSILVLGGDGTLSMAARCVIHQDIPLGIIPFGSANGMATELGIVNDPAAALEEFLKSRFVQEIDMYRVNKIFTGIHIGDVGLNAQIVEGFSQEKERGMFAYAKHFLKEISQYEPIRFQIETDREVITDSGYMLAFANAKKYGTGVIINWKGTLTDGKIELVIVKSIELKTLLLAGLSRYNSELVRETEAVRIISCTQALVRLDSPMTVQVDGEVIGKMNEIMVEVIPRAIKMIRNKTDTVTPF
jgi:diacylglycerol kinase family enzyme